MADNWTTLQRHDVAQRIEGLLREGIERGDPLELLTWDVVDAIETYVQAALAEQAEAQAAEVDLGGE